MKDLKLIVAMLLGLLAIFAAFGYAYKVFAQKDNVCHVENP